MKQTILSVILSFSLAVMTPGAVEIAKAETVPSEKQATVSLENGSYEEGSVIVTLASPDETTSSPKRAPHPLTSTSG